MIHLFEVPNLDATERLGRGLGPFLTPGTVLALIGPLGAGKTHFTRAIAEGLLVSQAAQVSSPTFVLIQEYAARLPIYHFDTYRLRNEDEFRDLGAEEYLHGNGVSIIEWADRVPGVLPSERMNIRIEVLDQDRRQLHVEALGSKYEQILTNWQRAAVLM